MNTHLSVTIITLNEEKYLPRCLESIKNLADEIILVDSGSTDKTVSIAKEFNAHIYIRKFDTYAQQKNFAAQKASGEWILSLDADEVVSPELKQIIKKYITNKNHSFSGFSIPRRNIIFGKFIRFTRWQPELDRHVWLWKNGRGKWVGDIHEEVEVDGVVGKLKYPKVHFQYETVMEFLAMMNRYSEIQAQELVRKEMKFSALKLIGDPFYNFFVRYIYRFGFFDGWRGFVLSFLMAIYHIEVWIKVWEKNKPISKYI